MIVNFWLKVKSRVKSSQKMFENHIIDKFNIVKPQKVITCKLLSYARNMLEVDLHFQKSDGHDSVV